MKHKWIALALSALFAMATFTACDTGENKPPVGGNEGGEGNNANVALFEGLPEIPFASFFSLEDSGQTRLKMKAKWTDSYNVNFSKKVLSEVKLYDETGKVLVDSADSFDIDLTAGQVVYAELVPVKQNVRINVTARENESPQPFEIAQAPDPDSFETTSADPTKDPLQAAELTYVKRPDTLYVYSNAPETLTPEAVNKCITRQDVSNQSVYFTYEHQSMKIVNEGVTKGVYYGYRVTNTGSEDMYVTVKNVGLQTAGQGAFLGEQEWVDFYNTNLPVRGMEDFTPAQKANFDAYFNFSGKYVHHNFQPTTYRVPAGEFIYVIGGTTKDAYGNYSVAGTADQISTFSEVTNGAVLFDVIGEAEGAFYIYDDIDAVNEGGAGYDTHVGVADMANPRGSVGMEEGYVVDGSATWIFNDATKPQNLPVNFTNYYNASLMGAIRGVDDTPEAIKAMQKNIADYLRKNYPDSVSTNIAEDGSIIPCSPIPDGKNEHRQLGLREWATHSDAQHYADAVGTDITIFNTVYSGGTDRPLKDISFGLYNFSTQGIVLEMGNWMKDYQDLFTFVNQGDKPRTVRIHLRPNGGLAAFFRDMNGKVIPGTEKSALYRGGGINPFYDEKHPEKNPIQILDAFDIAVHQEFTIPAHSVFQVVAEYNLMANSCGNVRHWVELV